MRTVIDYTAGTVKLKSFIFTIKTWYLSETDIATAIKEAEIEMDRLERQANDTDGSQGELGV